MKKSHYVVCTTIGIATIDLMQGFFTGTRLYDLAAEYLPGSDKTHLSAYVNSSILLVSAWYLERQERKEAERVASNATRVEENLLEIVTDRKEIK